MAAYNDFGAPQLPPMYLPEEESQGETKRLLRRSLSQGGTLSTTVQPGQSMLPNTIEKLRGRASEMYDKATKLMDQPLDYSGMQAFAQQRGQQGEQAMLNALAAQYAGEQFQPLQQQFMKTAASTQDPIKMGGGLITNTGQFIKDPEVAQDKQVAMLLNNAKAYEQQAMTAETARERIEAQRKHDQTMEQLRMMGLGLQQQGIDLRREIAANKTEDHSKTWRAEDTLRKDFDTLTKDLRDQLTETGKITQIINATPPGKKPDSLAQQSLVILLNKFLDPGSVVREGEFDRVVKAQGLEGRARNLSDRILKGQPLDANTIRQINDLAQLYSQAAATKIQSIANNYSDIATRRKLDVSNVISDPRYRGGQAPGGGVIDFNSLPK